MKRTSDVAPGLFELDMVEAEFIFNEETGRFFDLLPMAIREAISETQVEIERIVRKVFPAAICTSGFRCPRYNAAIGGRVDSFHLFGCARDYRLHPGFPKSISGLGILREKDHIHVWLLPE